ncbi:hypothetical protein [Xanthobacter autotrophicus]|uniref:hypothetical protein n=1 Tax=Xanthobacter autotrophicus TaxID=280 RepID=UPI0024A6E81F|nr:hypothetical protein [Xanthobacter autotrophicus]MDI4655376.1 hypothetical protein [Xanthobacter autotrophicus]
MNEISAYEQWIAEGGPGRAGLAPDLFAKFSALLAILKNELYILRAALLPTALQPWKHVDTTPPPGGNLMHVLLVDLAHKLSVARDTTNRCLTVSLQASVEATDLGGRVQRAIEDDLRSVEKANQQIELLGALRIGHEAVLRAARQQLQGSEGFKNGFLTALSLGIHNPVKANMDAANLAIARINTEAAIANATAMAARAHQSEVVASHQILQRINALHSFLVDRHNDLHEGVDLIESALPQIARADETTREAVRQIYCTRARPAMQRLELWAKNPQ